MKKLLIITDTTKEQINGVVRTTNATVNILKSKNFDVEILNTDNFLNISFPFYKEIKIALPQIWKVFKKIKNYNPDYIHISTEGVVGLMGIVVCKFKNLNYTTSYHTRFPEYLEKMVKIPKSISYAYFRWFHSKSKKVLVPTKSMKDILDKKNFKNTYIWNRGVDLSIFYPNLNKQKNLKPVLLYVGRVSVEKNIEEFLKLNIKATKMVVGDGPIKKELEEKYPDVIFTGAKTGKELSELYSTADVFVFPSKSDTYGLVLLEALASGLPIATYKEPGPIDISLENEELSKNCCFMSDDLEIAVKNAINNGVQESAIELSKLFSWEKCTEKFIKTLIKSKNEI